MSKAPSFREKFEILKESLDKIVEIVSVLTNKIIGSEELNPILTYCLLKANPLNWVSNMSFMKLMINDKDKKGEKGFALTKIEISTNIIEHADKRLFDCGKFSENVLKNEISMGIHLMKFRPKKLHTLSLSSAEYKFLV